MDDSLFDVFNEKPQTASIATADPNIQASVNELLRQTVPRDEDDEEAAEVAPKKLRVDELENNVAQMPRIQIHKVKTVEACLHEVAVPPGIEYQPLQQSTRAPAKEFPFLLDPFQKEAVLCLENNQSVLVAAHTSAGKTVVAIYAIALAFAAKQRVVYTSPIKALSNQKYRELYEMFGDVGLMTGDVTINPNASCLVMTTEVCRSMLYRGSEVMREVAWVIFDEIHYMRDAQRGVVWEETIILLPDNIRYVFLSATIPNARQFVEWIAYIHKQSCHVVYTDYRPTPLQHYLFPAGGSGIHLVVNENGEFIESNFQNALKVLNEAGDAAAGDVKGRKGGFKYGGGTGSNCFKIVKMVTARQLAPMIVFAFARKDLEAYSLEVAGKLDFNTSEEKKLVNEVFENAIGQLGDDDKKLPQIENTLPLLLKGVGIHHSGLLPLLKEIIEILFQEGLIKVLFATETFSMGLNMPARTVFFTQSRKWDGKEWRWVNSGEYIQMSGRAGRRGIDDKGIVILMVDEGITPQACKQIIKGQPEPLNSQFRLTYNMVLNLLRVEEINPEFMMEKSFHQFQNYASLPGLYEKLQKSESEFLSFTIPSEDSVATFFTCEQQVTTLQAEVREIMTKPKHLLPFLQPGRLLYIVNKNDDHLGWGVSINFHKRAATGREETEPSFVSEVLLPVPSEVIASRDSTIMRPVKEGERHEWAVVPVMMNLIYKISSVRINLPKSLQSLDSREGVAKVVTEVQRRFPDGVPLLHPLEDMGIKDENFKALHGRLELYEKRLREHALQTDPRKTELLAEYKRKQELAAEVLSTKTELKRRCSLLHMTDLKARKRVLRRLGYVDQADVIQIKGRIACEISAADELLLTELLFNGVFNNLTPAQSCALLSCLLFQDKCNEMPKLSEDLSQPLRVLQETARRLGKVQKECKLDIDVDKYCEALKASLMDVVFAWASGSSFLKIASMTEAFEGSIVRTIRRLDETLREMSAASKAIGNTDLENKFAQAMELIKRDIVFAASLYL